MSKKRNKNPKMTVRAAARVLKNMKAAPAAMSQRTMQKLEEAIGSDNYGVTRRGSFLVLTISGKKLLRDIAQNRDFAVAVAAFSRNAGRYIDALESLLDIMRQASTRMVCALATRPDMHSILDEANAAERRGKPALRVIAGGKEAQS